VTNTNGPHSGPYFALMKPRVFRIFSMPLTCDKYFLKKPSASEFSQMMKTPTIITKKMTQLAARSGSKSDGYYIDIESLIGCKPHICHINVDRRIKAHGGSACNGWVIWEHERRLFLQSEFHCVWQDEEGILHDITPDVDGETKRLFFPSKQSWTGFMRPGLWVPLKKNREIVEVCELLRQEAEVRSRTKVNERVPPEDMREMDRLRKRIVFLLSKVA
jgi:hypothetical protein